MTKAKARNANANARKPQGTGEKPKGPPFPKPDDFQPVSTFENGRPRCQAWARNAGRQCRRHPEPGKRVCRLHGGAEGSGRPPIHAKHTNLSRLATNVERLLGDQDLLNLRGEIKTLAIRHDQLVGRIADGNPIADLAALREAVGDVTAALAFDDRSKAQLALGRLLALIDLGVAEVWTWREIERVSERIRSLTKDQATLEIATGVLVPSAELVAVVNVFQHLMFRFIPEPQMRSAFIRIMRSQFDQAILEEPRNVTPESAGN